MIARARRHRLLLAIIGVAALLRLAWLGSVPAGLNPDEASIAYDAWALLHYGIDRNGQSWPVHLISWGSGQNALYAYLSFPFVALFGPTAWGIRLLQAFAGIATLPLVYVIGVRAFDRRTALIATAFVAFSPWHIALSRWALEANLVVAVFTAAVACLITGTRFGLVSGAALLGMSLYAYGSAWVAAPLMLIIAIGLAWRAGSARIGSAFAAGAMFALTALPIALFVAVNSLRLPSVMIGPTTIPRLTSAPRYETQAAAGAEGVPATILDHLAILVRTVVGETDGLAWNTTPPFGLFYHLLGVLGVVGVVQVLRGASDWRPRLLIGWVAAAIPIGLIQAANVNRINLIFVPLFILAAYAVTRLADHRPAWRVLPVTGVVLAVGLTAFLPAYARQQRPGFDADLIPAIIRARKAADGGTVCITTQAGMPYVYALLADHTDPHVFAATVRYTNPTDPFREVTGFQGYGFGACPSAAAYVLAPGDPARGAPVAQIGRYVIAKAR